MKVKYLFIMMMLFALADSSMAQTTRRRTTTSKRDAKKEDVLPFKQKLNYEIHIGNPNISNIIVALAIKPNVGYKINNTFTAGLGSRLFYTYYNPGGGGSANYFDLGAFAFARAKLGGSIYFQGEYSAMHFSKNYTGLAKNIAYPLVGGGYMNGYGNWKYGVELLLPLNNEARSYGPSLEYWFNISYKF
jgi:hypothetical protein